MEDGFSGSGDLFSVEVARAEDAAEEKAREAQKAGIYSVPALRPCLRILPDGAAGIQAGLEQRYDELTHELPLLGRDAMGPGDQGELLLGDRLRARMPWMEPAITRIEDQVRVAIWAGRPWLSWRPICLVGEPGSGKSHFAREISRIAGIPHAALDLGAMHDAAALVAVSRGWTNTKPAWPCEMMAALRCANPILTLDEIEKAGGSRQNGDPHTALLGMMEPSTAAVYFDTCLMAKVDLSAICWIATANSVDALPSPLRSRLEIIRVEGPNTEHFELLLRNVGSDLAARWRVAPASMPELPVEACRVLRKAFTRHRSVRILQRHVETVLTAIIGSGSGSLH